MTTDDTPIETTEAEARPWRGDLPPAAAAMPPALAAFDSAVTEVGVRNVLLADRLRGAFVRRLAALGSEPEGWRLVPVEPTPEQEGAGNRVTWPMPCRQVYRAMIAAAPAAPVVPQPAAQQGEAVAPDDYFLRGICVSLQVITAFDNGVLWAELVRTAGVDDLLNYATFVEPEEWELAGFAKYAWRELKRSKPRRQSAQPAAAPQPVAQGDVRDAEAELNCAEEVLDSYASELDLERTYFECVGDYIQAVVEATKAAAPAGVVGEPVAWGWAIVDKNGDEAFVRSRLTRFFGAENTEREPFTHEDLAVIDRENSGLAPHRIVTLYTAPPARQALTDEQRDAVLLSVIQKLNSNPYSLTKSECISEVQSMRSSGIGG